MATYYIDSGRGNGFYTLRETLLVQTETTAYEQTRYVKTLSRDWDKAVAKARAYIQDGDKLEGAEFALNDWGDADTDTYIAYEPSPEEVEARAKAKAEREAKWQKIQAEREAEYAALSEIPVTDDRIEIKGTVQKVYSKETKWGNTYRAFILDDRGYKLNGAEPKSANWHEGDRVSFYATVSPSNNDPKFGFYSRPTKVEVLN